MPTTATLLDALDAVKDTRDGTLAYRKSCRMAVCGSCGMRMDGGAVLACKTAMKPFVDAGHVVTVSPMGNLPVIKDLVVDMAPFWQKIHAVKPFLDSSDVEAPEREWRVTPTQAALISKESLCIMCGCCVSECNSMESDPDFLGPAALAKAYRFVGDVRDGDARNRLKDLSGAHGIWDCTRCYFCNQRCPKGVDPRDAIAKLGAEAFREGLTRDEGAQAREGVRRFHLPGGYLRETELVPKTIGPIGAIHADPVRAAAGARRQGAEPAVAAQGEGQRRGEAALEAARGADADHEGTRRPRRRGSRSMKDRYAYYPGCLASLSQKELDSSSRAIMAKLGVELVDMPSVTCCGAGDIHEAKPDYYLHISARILGQAERTGCDTILTICNVCTLNLRQANERLQENPEELARINDNLQQAGIGGYEGGVDVRHLLWEVSTGRRVREVQADRRQVARGAEGGAVLRLPDPAPGEAARLRGSRPARVARAAHHGLRRRADRLPGEDQVLRLPDRAGARGRRARRARAAAAARPPRPAPT